MEIERKYLVSELPANLDTCKAAEIEQAYICRNPVIRVRRAGDRFILTCKGQGLMRREELNLPLDEAVYYELKAKAEGTVIKKTRYYIPYRGLTIELDVFESPRRGLVMAEVEFPDEEAAEAFEKPPWFAEEVTFDPAFQNANMSGN